MEAERTYYPINENAAKLSNDMMSFSDYKTGSLTAQYQAAVNEVYQMAENKPDDRREDALYWAGRYAKKYAEYLNREVEIGTRCPSVMISGGSNFNVRKKEKQVAAWEKNRENLKYCDKIRERIEFIGTHREPITSNDTRAIEKLQDKLDSLTDEQNHMKAVNAYYKKHNTLDGCPELDHTEIEKLKVDMADYMHYEKKPYMTWMLTNNNANIKRITSRIASIQKAKDEGTKEVETDKCRVVENAEIMRIQLFFPDKPDASTRYKLKSNGFHWSPSQSAWQRQLNTHGRYATERVLAQI